MWFFLFSFPTEHSLDLLQGAHGQVWGLSIGKTWTSWSKLSRGPGADQGWRPPGEERLKERDACGGT